MRPRALLLALGLAACTNAGVPTAGTSTPASTAVTNAAAAAGWAFSDQASEAAKAAGGDQASVANLEDVAATMPAGQTVTGISDDDGDGVDDDRSVEIAVGGDVVCVTVANLYMLRGIVSDGDCSTGGSYLPAPAGAGAAR